MRAGGVPDQSSSLRVAAGVLGGGGVLLATMLLLAAAAVFAGRVAPGPGGAIALDDWLRLELAGGIAAGLLAGAISRRIAGSFGAPCVLALITLTLGLLEAAELLRQISLGAVVASRPLVVLTPLLGVAAILVGGQCHASRAVTAQATEFLARGHLVLRGAAAAAVLAAATAVAAFALPTMPAGTEAHAVAAAVTIDLTLTFPAVVYLLFVRGRRLPWLVLAPAFGVGYLLAATLIPPQQQAALEVLRLLIVPAEAALLAYIVWRVRAAITGVASGAGDLATRFRRAAEDTLGSRLAAGILATEFSLLYYALRRPTRPTADPHAFTCHREVNYVAVMWALTLILLLETVSVHLLVTRWSPAAAWVLTALSGYGLLWLIGDYRALASRPTRITSEMLHLRVGVRWEADIPAADILSAETVRPSAPACPGALSAGLLGQCTVRIRLVRPIEVVGLYGQRRRTSEVWLRVDRAGEFCLALRKDAD